jgi:NAD(P)-dependent dehydrogenase (short-subunit alcohol dehydrogenase family)
MTSRVVVVTGAGRGIGAAIARSFGEDGDVVMGLDRAFPGPSPAGVEHVAADISRVGDVERVFGRLDRIDVLVNCAAIQRVGLVGAQPFAEWESVIATNLNGTYYCCSSALPRMSKGSAIVSIASVAALLALPGRGAYCAAKAALLSLTRVMAVELADRGIRANAVCPGFTRTALIQQGLDDGSLSTDWMLERVPFGRLAEVEEIVQAVRFLASDCASFITGQSLVVDGGWSVQGISSAPSWLQGRTTEGQ